MQHAFSYPRNRCEKTNSILIIILKLLQQSLNHCFYRSEDNLILMKMIDRTVNLISNPDYIFEKEQPTLMNIIYYNGETVILSCIISFGCVSITWKRKPNRIESKINSRIEKLLHGNIIEGPEILMRSKINST